MFDAKMIPGYKKVHNKFKLNNIHYDYDSLQEVAYSFVKEGCSHEKEFGMFLLDWLDSNTYVNVKTSGSTGSPKNIKLNKQAMVRSAIETGDFFKLMPSDSSLLCLSSQYIAGKMMIVRALILGLQLDLIKPTSRPLDVLNKSYDFIPMVPIQLQNSLDQLHHVKKIIVGGAKVSFSLIQKLQSISPLIYETYGMSETITHIAVKKLNHNKSSKQQFTFFTLPNVAISQDERGCLVIDAPHLKVNSLVTNDLVKIYSENSFELLGRIDNVINSGGIKIFPEQIEKQLSRHIDTDFFITSRKNQALGEEIILLIEGDQRDLSKNLFENLKKFEIPKRVLFIHTFFRLSSGKIDRIRNRLTIL